MSLQTSVLLVQKWEGVLQWKYVRVVRGSILILDGEFMARAVTGTTVHQTL